MREELMYRINVFLYRLRARSRIQRFNTFFDSWFFENCDSPEQEEEIEQWSGVLRLEVKGE